MFEWIMIIKTYKPYQAILFVKKGYGLVSASSQPYCTRPTLTINEKHVLVPDTVQYDNEINQSAASVRVELIIIKNIISAFSYKSQPN